MTVSDWNIIDYRKAWQQQEKLFEEMIFQKKQHLPTENRLILCQHPHVYTLGKSGKEENLLQMPENAQFVQTNRGGDITYHGEGQIVGYPIFDLETFDIGLKEYIFRLEEIIIDLLKIYDINATRQASAAGVWLDVDTKFCRKICAIGVRSSHFVTMHGFALNVNTDLSYFQHINPCGFTDKGVTSMQKELGQNVDIEEVKRNLKKIFEQHFS